jgi:hypothetical protein
MISSTNISNHHGVNRQDGIPSIPKDINIVTTTKCASHVVPQGVDSLLRRQSASNESRSSSTGASAHSERDELLARVIAQEMISSLLKNSRHVIDEVMDTMNHPPVPKDHDDSVPIASTCNDAQDMSSRVDRELRKYLQLQLSQVDFWDNMDESSHPSSQANSSRRTHKSSKATSHSGTTTTTTGTNTESQASNTTSDKPAPMDIWHPDFWDNSEHATPRAPPVPHRQQHSSLQADATEEEEVLSSSKPQSVSFTTNSHANTGASNTTNSHHSEFDDLLTRFQEIITNPRSDVDEYEMKDDASVVSDVTGLTEVFPKDKAHESHKKRGHVSLKPNTQRSGQPKTTTVTSQPLPKPTARSVTFGHVHVRIHQRCISDHPACTNGPAIGIDWPSRTLRKPIDMDEWEMERGRWRRPSDLVLSRHDREDLLREWGYTDKDIAASVREINRVKAMRRQTVNNLGIQKMEEAMEHAKRKLFSPFSSRAKKL